VLEPKASDKPAQARSVGFIVGVDDVGDRLGDTDGDTDGDEVGDIVGETVGHN